MLMKFLVVPSGAPKSQEFDIRFTAPLESLFSGFGGCDVFSRGAHAVAKSDSARLREELLLDGNTLSLAVVDLRTDVARNALRTLVKGELARPCSILAVTPPRNQLVRGLPRGVKVLNGISDDGFLLLLARLFPSEVGKVCETYSTFRMNRILHQRQPTERR